MAYRTRVLVVANVTASSPDLIEALRQRAEAGDVAYTLLMPARREMESTALDEALTLWREQGLEVEGRMGDADPVEAATEAWDPTRFDEVIVSTLPGATSKWLTVDVPHRIDRVTDARVTHVVSRPPGYGQPASGPPRAREHNPLAVLSWGGRRS